MAEVDAASERRKQVLIGDLPNDFLRLGTPCTSADQQVALDEQAARALQHQLNSPAKHPAGAVIPGSGTILGAPGFYGGFVPPNTRGRLSVTVLSAKLTKNYGIVRMDPYCRLRVGNTVFETPTDVSGGKSPKWNRTVHCYLPEGVQTVFLEIFDEVMGYYTTEFIRAFTTDERVAWAHIPIPEAAFSNETVEDWYQLTGQQGEGKEGMIQMVFAFAPVDAPPVQYVPISQPPNVVLVPGQQAVVQPGGGYMYAQQQHQQAGQVVPPGPLYTEEDVKEMCDMFPNVDKEVVTSVLDEKRGNKDAAVNALLSMASD